MKKVYLLIIIVGVLKLASCKKDDQTATSTTSGSTTSSTSGSTTSTTSGTTTSAVDTIPLAASNTSIINSVTYSYNYNECLNPGAGYYYITGQIGTSFCKVYLKSQPTANKVYTVVSKPGSSLAVSEAGVEIGIADKNENWYSVSGKLTLKITGGKATAWFNNVAMKENKTGATSTASGNLTCP